MGIVEDYLACKGNFDCYVRVYKESSEYAKDEAYDILVKHCGCDPDKAHGVTQVGSVKLWVYLGPDNGWVGDNYKRQIDVDKIKKKWETA